MIEILFDPSLSTLESELSVFYTLGQMQVAAAIDVQSPLLFGGQLGPSYAKRQLSLTSFRGFGSSHFSTLSLADQ